MLLVSDAQTTSALRQELILSAGSAAASSMPAVHSLALGSSTGCFGQCIAPESLDDSLPTFSVFRGTCGIDYSKAPTHQDVMLEWADSELSSDTINWSVSVEGVRTRL